MDPFLNKLLNIFFRQDDSHPDFRCHIGPKKTVLSILK